MSKFDPVLLRLKIECWILGVEMSSYRVRKTSWVRWLVRLWSDRLTGLSMAVLPKPPLEPVSAKLAYLKNIVSFD